MKKNTFIKIGVTLLGWGFLMVMTANIARMINPSTSPENMSVIEISILLLVTFFGWVPFYLYFKKNNGTQDGTN